MATRLLAGLDILVIEDESLLRKQIAAHLEALGADVTGAATLAVARQAITSQGFDFALLDLGLPDGQGIALLQEKAFAASTGVVVMTANGAVSGAVECMRLGAVDYLVKPFDVVELPLVIARARRQKQEARLHEHRRRTESVDDLFFGDALAPLRERLEKILAADRRMQSDLPPVLIEGETGTGKTAMARWLHQQGPRAEQPLVEVNCSAVPETLAESELFGHERGAFTDARAARIGLFEAANGGTLFLDELPSLPLALQAKILKAIEDRRIRRLGGTRELPVDARVIAATHRDLRDLVQKQQFREDLLHRLDLYRLVLPPLRARGRDLLKLAELLLQRLCSRHRIEGRRISEAGGRRLLAYPWPGNVRELAHELERAIVFESGPELHFERLVASAGAGRGLAPDQWFNPEFRFPETGFELDQAIEQLIQHALAQTDRNVSAAARLLGVSRDFLRYRLSGQKPEPSSDAGTPTG